MDKYRSLKAWQYSRRLSLTVLDVTESNRAPKNWAVFDQLKRAAVSVEANIVEGFAYGTTPAFLRHLRIALGSAAEVEILLELSDKRRYMSREVTSALLGLVNLTLGSIFGLIRTLRRRDR